MKSEHRVGDSIQFGMMVLTIGAVIRLGASIYLPALPFIGAEFHASKSMMSQTVSVYFLVFALCTLIAGPLSDTFGRKIVLQTGITFFIMGSILCALSRQYEMLFAGRVIQAFGASMIPGTLMAMIRDAASDARVVALTGWLAVLGGLLLVAAPLLGGVLTHFLGWSSNFWFLVFFSAIVWIIALFKLPETHPLHARSAFSIQQTFHRFWTMLISAPFILTLLPVIVFFGIQGAFLAAAPYIIIKKYAFTPVEFGLSNIIIVAGIFFGRSLGARILKKYDATAVYRIGGTFSFLLIFLFICMAVGLFDTPVFFFITMAFFATLYGILSPIGIKSSLTAFRTAAGTAAALQGALLLGASALGSALTGFLAATSLFSSNIHTAFAIVSATFTLIAAFAALRARHQLQ